MNFDPAMSTGFAIFAGLLAASMWGTWFISLKYLGDYPLEAFYLTLFTSSLILVWGLGFILDGSMLIENIVNVWRADRSRVIVTLVCGFLYVTGMQFSLRVYNILGLSLSQPLQQSINLIIGTSLSGLIGGVPAGMTVQRIVTGAAFLLGAILLTITAGNIRNKAQDEQKVDTGLSKDPKVIRKAIFLLVISSAFIPAYSTGLSYGLKSITQPNGMAVMPFMAMLCTGAFLSALVICGTTLTVRKQWHVFLEKGFRIHKFGMLSGMAHYGGNIIHTFATRNLSSVVSWPLGITAGLWTQMWGLIYGEFKGSPKKTYVFFFSGVLFYLLGAVIISGIAR